MKFEDAIKEMKKGNKVRFGDFVVELFDSTVLEAGIRVNRIDGKGLDYPLSANWVMSNQWEIYEEKEKKTLSDKINEGGLGDWVYVKDAKEHLKEFMDWFNCSITTTIAREKKAKEIFGDRLIK